MPFIETAEKPLAAIEMEFNREQMRRAVEFYLNERVLKRPCAVTQVLQLRDDIKSGRFSIILQVEKGMPIEETPTILDSGVPG